MIFSFITIYAQTDYDGIYEEATNRINEENYFEAIKLLQLIQDTDNYMVFYSLGYCYYFIENDALAQANLRRSIELNDELKQRLRMIKQNFDDERIRSLTRFTIDTFIHKDFYIFVEETFDLSGNMYYHWVFKIFDNNNNFIRNVNLESSLVLRELGTAFIVGIDIFENNRRIHQTTSIGFKILPEYNVMKNVVIEEIEKGLPISVTGIYPYAD
jgi:tetratricopeptide (TPR) repeat protein